MTLLGSYDRFLFLFLEAFGADSDIFEPSYIMPYDDNKDVRMNAFFIF